MGGLDTLAKLRDSDPKVRAIVASGYAHDPVLADPGSHGFVAGIRKPIDFRELAEVVASAVAPA